MYRVALGMGFASEGTQAMGCETADSVRAPRPLLSARAVMTLCAALHSPAAGGVGALVGSGATLDTWAASGVHADLGACAAVAACATSGSRVAVATSVCAVPRGISRSGVARALWAWSAPCARAVACSAQVGSTNGA